MLSHNNMDTEELLSFKDRYVNILLPKIKV